MSYNRSNYPAVMKNLPDVIKNRAINILNTILTEHDEIEERYAITISINKAKEWVREHVLVENKGPNKNKYYVVHRKDGWAVKTKTSMVSYHYRTKIKAVKTAKKLAKENHAKLIIEDSKGTIQVTHYYN